MLKNIQSGIYAITPTSLRADELLNAVEDTLSSGIEIIQYRFDDCINFDERLKTATKLKKICIEIMPASLLIMTTCLQNI